MGCTKVCTQDNRVDQSDSSSLPILWQNLNTQKRELSARLSSAFSDMHSCFLWSGLIVFHLCTGSALFFSFLFLVFGLSRPRQSVTFWQILFWSWKLMPPRCMGCQSESFKRCSHWRSASQLGRLVQIQLTCGLRRRLMQYPSFVRSLNGWLYFLSVVCASCIPEWDWAAMSLLSHDCKFFRGWGHV